MVWGRNSVLLRSKYEKKNDPAWTGDPVDARSLYLFFAGFYRLFKFVLFRSEENNQVCPSTYNDLVPIIAGSQHFSN